MKTFIATASMLLFVLAAQTLGLAFGTEEATANDLINVTHMNETLKNATLTNLTLENITLINGTLGNESAAQNDSNPFADAKNRQPKRP
jgi:hypothetical protein